MKPGSTATITPRGCLPSAELLTGAEALSEVLGVEDPDAFWESVDANLESERFRLIFVSDAIAPELRRIIEFLNGQMTRTDVLAIEVKQYVDAQGEHQTVVPQVIGNTESAKRTKNAGPVTTRTELLGELEPRAADAARAVFDWAEAHPNLALQWKRTGNVVLAARGLMVFRVWPDGNLDFGLNTLRRLDPAWHDDDQLIDTLLQELQAIPGIGAFESKRLWARTQLSPLADAPVRDTFLGKVAGVLDRLVPGSDGDRRVPDA